MGSGTHSKMRHLRPWAACRSGSLSTMQSRNLRYVSAVASAHRCGMSLHMVSSKTPLNVRVSSSPEQSNSLDSFSYYTMLMHWAPSAWAALISNCFPTR